MVTCNPLTIRTPDGYQAWCKACHWESATYPARSQATAIADRRKDQQQCSPPPAP